MEQNLTDIQKYSLQLLIEFDAVCKEHNLRYFIIGGTLLGAIRHKGFIPWDDDVDVAMPREDYERLIRETGNYTKYPYYVANYKNTDNEFILHRMAALFRTKEVQIRIENNGQYLTEDMGLDILPIDGTPDNKIVRKLYFFKILFLRALFKSLSIDKVEVENGNNRKKIEKLIIIVAKHIDLNKIFDKRKVLQKLENSMKKYDMYTAKKMCGTFLGAYRTREIVDKKYFMDAEKYNFEGYEVWGPKDYDGYLTCIYGDYMKLPPVEKRVNKHKSTVLK